MTSLHVICGLGPPIKNPGYAYDRAFVNVESDSADTTSKRLFKHDSYCSENTRANIAKNFFLR